MKNSTQGIIKVKAENNVKCYVNGIKVYERHNTIFPFGNFKIEGSGRFYYSYENKYYQYKGYGKDYELANYEYIDVSKELKKGNNIIACEAWVDSNAYPVFHYLVL